MSQQEGVIQFRLSHTSSDAVDYSEFGELIAWHKHMHKLGLIGQDPSRYSGFAYGNMSHRLHDNVFLISGTQTGGIASLDAEHYACIDNCNIAENKVTSHGPVKPSSECMSHAAIYTASPKTRAIIHVHNPSIWQHYQALGLASTAADVDYGTPEMANAVASAIEQLDYPDCACIAMLGHEDGVICFAKDMETVGQHLLVIYEQAVQLDSA